MSFKTTTIARVDTEKVYEGLRIPPTLDTVTSVNFVLTQEPGKLKPKDLKAAIERNRAEREQRAEEQKRLRDEGGGAGLLDLRGILAEERLNSNEGDPFQRQLREMAFLADVEEVDKLETEKGFRVSEDYLGSQILGEGDISIVYKQRRLAALHKKRTEWRRLQARNHTGLFTPTHALIKAGASAETSQTMLKTLTPHFDTNRNDIWGKRMNTLRRFISLVSRWIVRRRVAERMSKVMQLFSNHGAVTRDEVKHLIEILHAKKLKVTTDSKKPAAVAVTAGGESTGGSLQQQGSWDKERPASLNIMVFSSPNETLKTRESNEAIIEAAEESTANGGSEVSAEMARRILFPQCNPSSGGGAHREEINTHDPNAAINFDDRTFFQLKVKPDFLTFGYQPLQYSPAPLYFPPCNAKALRQGAPEELALRPPANAHVDAKTIESWHPAPLPDEPDVISNMIALPAADKKEDDKDKDKEALHATAPDEVDIDASEASQAPAWVYHTTKDDKWAPVDLNFFASLPKYRVFGPPGPRRCEMDADWILRPDSEPLVVERDDSLRSKWLAKPGFQSVNTYLLGSYEARNTDPPPPPGPTLTLDYYQPDTDRHASGLSCFERDHLRGTFEHDPDVAPLQHQQDKADYLTDSESDDDNDDEEQVRLLRPTMAKVRQILRPPPPAEPEPTGKDAKGGKGAKPAAAAAAAPAVKAAAMDAPQTNDTMGSEGFGLGAEDEAPGGLAAGQRKEEQVELLRDRKMLDMESTLDKARKARFDSVAKRLCEVSKASSCLVQALPVQMPFHSYEEQVYKLMEPRMPPLNNHHVEFNARQSYDSLPQQTHSTTALTPAFSPT